MPCRVMMELSVPCLGCCPIKLDGLTTIKTLNLC
uniref:Uncharacterized protein n=1 Tax=Rhizophora mucronata TaxID=61149 RepID=A0A2P2NSK1_RHIMU